MATPDAVNAQHARRLANTPTPTVTTNVSARTHHSYARGVLDYFRGPKKPSKPDPNVSDAHTVMAVDLAVSTTPSPNTHPLHTKPRARDEYLRGLVANRESTFGLPVGQVTTIAHAKNMAYQVVGDAATSDALLRKHNPHANPTRPGELYQKNLRDREKAAIDTASEKKYIQEWGFYLKCYAEGRYNLSWPPTPPPKRKEFSYLVPPLPANELERLATVSYMSVPIPEWAAARARDLVGHAMFIFKVPYASISYFDKDKEIFKAEYGYLRASIPRHISIGAHGLLSLDPMVIMDTHQDWRFAKNPLVLERPHIRFYASAPLIAKDGSIIGVFAIFSPSPTRSFLDMHRQSLVNFTKRAMTDAELLVEDFNSLDTDYKSLDDPGRVLEERFSLEGSKPAATPTSSTSPAEPSTLPTQTVQTRTPTAQVSEEPPRNRHESKAILQAGELPNEGVMSTRNVYQNNSPLWDGGNSRGAREASVTVSQQAKEQPSSSHNDNFPGKGKEEKRMVPYKMDGRVPFSQNSVYSGEPELAKSITAQDNKNAFLHPHPTGHSGEKDDELYLFSDTDSFSEYAMEQSRSADPSKGYEIKGSAGYDFSLLRRMQEEEDHHSKYGENAELLLNEVPEGLNIMKRRNDLTGQRNTSSTSSSEQSFAASTRQRQPYSSGVKSILSESSGLTDSSATTWSTHDSVQMPPPSNKSDPLPCRPEAIVTDDTSDAATFKRNFFDKHWGPAAHAPDVHPSAHRTADANLQGLNPPISSQTSRTLQTGSGLNQIFPSPPSSPASLPPKRKSDRIELALSSIARELDFDVVFILRMVASGSKIPTPTNSSLNKKYTAQLLFSHGMPLLVPFVCNPEVHLGHILRGNSVRFGVPTLAERRGVSSDYELGILSLLSLPLSPEIPGNAGNSNSNSMHSGGALPLRIPQFGRIHIFGAFRKTAPPGACISDSEESILQDEIKSLRHIFFSTHIRENHSS